MPVFPADVIAARLGTSSGGSSLAPRIFLSSAPADDALAEQLATMLQTRGCSVWRHQERSKSAGYRAATLQAIAEAQIVVVLWSATSSGSAWVIDEADAGMKKGATVAVEVAEAKGPLGFAGSVRVKAATSGIGFSKQDHGEIWEGVLDVADLAGLLGPRRLWLDRSLGATLANVLANLAIFELLALAATAVNEPHLFLGVRGRLLCLTLGAISVACGYGGDWLVQKLGFGARAYRRRLMFRWCAESVGAGLGALSFYVVVVTSRPHDSSPWFIDALLVFGGALSLVSFVLLGLKFLPLLLSRRLQRRFLGRPS
jgi:hypothetical protein